MGMFDRKKKKKPEYGPSTINVNARDMMQQMEGMQDVAEPRPGKIFHKLDDEKKRRRGR